MSKYLIKPLKFFTYSFANYCYINESYCLLPVKFRFVIDVL